MIKFWWRFGSQIQIHTGTVAVYSLTV